MKNRLIISQKLTTLNQYIDIERGSKYGAADKKKDLTNNVMLEVLSQRKQIKLPADGLYDLKLYWITKNNATDPDNIYFSTKFILDGIVKAKLLSGDGRKQIRNIDNKIRTIKGKQFVIVRFVPVKPPISADFLKDPNEIDYF